MAYISDPGQSYIFIYTVFLAGISPNMQSIVSGVYLRFWLILNISHTSHMHTHNITHVHSFHLSGISSIVCCQHQTSIVCCQHQKNSTHLHTRAHSCANAYTHTYIEIHTSCAQSAPCTNMPCKHREWYVQTHITDESKPQILVYTHLTHLAHRYCYIHTSHILHTGRSSCQHLPTQPELCGCALFFFLGWWSSRAWFGHFLYSCCFCCCCWAGQAPRIWFGWNESTDALQQL